MNRPNDPITAFDLDAYVDDQLDMARRIEVEDHLAHHPTIAARVMADMRTRDTLRLSFPNPPSAMRGETVDAARRLERALARARVLGRLQRFATAAVIAAIGWFAHAEFGTSPSVAAPTPTFVDDALSARRAEALRIGMPSQSLTATYDPAEIRAATDIAMPALPKDWRVIDVQVVPSSAGPSVELAFETEGLGRAFLFAARMDRFAVTRPAVAHKSNEAVAFWQIGDTAYALTAAADRDLDATAKTLANSLY
jgi:anti-sigma factor RsiW